MLLTLNDLPRSILKLVLMLLITYLFTRVINGSCFVTLVRQSNYNWHPLLQINGRYDWKSNTWSLCFMWQGRPEKNPDLSWTLNKLSREIKCQPCSHLERGNEKLTEFMLHLCCQMAANSQRRCETFPNCDMRVWRKARYLWEKLRTCCHLVLKSVPRDPIMSKQGC